MSWLAKLKAKMAGSPRNGMVTLEPKANPDRVKTPTPTGGRDNETLATSWVGVTEMEIPLPPRSCKKSSRALTNEKAPSNWTLPMLTSTWVLLPDWDENEKASKGTWMNSRSPLLTR